MNVAKAAVEMVAGKLLPDGRSATQSLRDHDRFVERKKGEIQRVLQRMTQAENRCKGELRGFARVDNKPMMRSKAAEIVVLRRSQRGLQNIVSGLSNVQVSIMLMEGMVAGAEALEVGNQVMEAVNMGVPPDLMEEIAQQFQQQLSFLNSKAAIMQESLDDAMYNPEDEADTNDLLTEVMQEVLNDMRQELAPAVARPVGILLDGYKPSAAALGLGSSAPVAENGAQPSS